jgi:hypothetical protein
MAGLDWFFSAAGWQKKKDDNGNNNSVLPLYIQFQLADFGDRLNRE